MTNPVALSDLAAALDALILEDAPPMVGKDEFTAMDLVRRYGWGERKARKTVKGWEQAGRIEPVGLRRVPSGHTVPAWRVK
jgi:hypothetical protein